MHKFLGLILVFGALSAIFAVLEWAFAANPAQKRLRAGFKTDLVYWFTTPLFFKAVSTFGTAVFLSILYHTKPPQLKALFDTRQTWVTVHLPLALQILSLLVIADIMSYWLHRLFHGKKLWKFHAVHHCSEELDWLSAVRVHPVNEWITRWIEAVVLLGLGFNPASVALYIPFLTFYAIMLHANVKWDFGWFGNIIASPRFHRWHHTAQEEGLDKNFAGLFPWIDRIFGTYYMPKGKMPDKFGLYNERIPNSFWGQMAYPFKRKTP